VSIASTPGPARRDGYADLVREVRGLGLLRPRPAFYVLLDVGVLCSLAGVVIGLWTLRESWWVLLLAPVYGVVSAQLAFFSHDAAHRQITRSARLTRGLCLVHGNLLNGLSYGWWTAKHNAHHAHPNDLETDPDVAVGALVFDRAQAEHRQGLGAWLTRHQAVIFFPILTLEAYNLRISSIRATLRDPMPHRFAEGSMLLAHLVLYCGLVFGALPWWHAIAFLLLHQAVFGVYLGCTFAPSHKGMPTLSGEDAADPLLRQVLTSRNIRGGRHVDLLMGGLNLQIEHHLFPSMPRPNLRRLQPVVQRYCDTHGVGYAEESLFGAYRAALDHLHEVGALLRDAPDAVDARPGER
jgi:fatty acid desaturase